MIMFADVPCLPGIDMTDLYGWGDNELSDRSEVQHSRLICIAGFAGETMIVRHAIGATRKN